MTGHEGPDDVREHYEAHVDDEDGRLRTGLGRLERARVQEIVRRHLPSGPQRILDVGGATGVHAEWLLGDGHTVHLVDPVGAQVAVATDRLAGTGRFTAAVGDARALPVGDATVDAVLLLGPLYHLLERADRVTAWREAARAVVPGGVVLGMAISRFASLFDGLAGGFLYEEEFRRVVDADLATGRHTNPTRHPHWFTTAYFQHPTELAEEVGLAGLDLLEVVGVEGMGGWLRHLTPDWDAPARRAVILEAARVIEAEPSLAGLSPHLVAVAHRRPDGAR
jgi:SAM-dependent methyltransferase